MEGHWLNGPENATEQLVDLDRGDEFQRRRKMEERGTSNEGLRRERMRAVSLSERLSRSMDKRRARPRLSDSWQEPGEVHDY